VPWEYQDVVPRYLRSSDVVLDIGTGGGERLGDLARSFGHGLGIDADPGMVVLASENSAAGNLGFRVCSERLESVPETFDVIIDRHAPFDLSAVAAQQTWSKQATAARLTGGYVPYFPSQALFRTYRRSAWS
jgi:SAM-dependent methyltransferase